MSAHAALRALDIAARADRLFRSVTPADDGALPYLQRLLAEAGFAAEIVSFAAPGTPRDRQSLRALRRPARRNLVFAGHTDVVPPGDVAQVALRSLLGASRRRRDLGPRRLRHEGRRRRRGSPPRCASSRAARSRARSASSSPATRKGRRSTARSSCSNGRSRRASVSIIACSASRPASARSATRSRTDGAAR